MRFKRPMIGDRRERTFFALLPVWAETSRGRTEVRWLERVTVREEYAYSWEWEDPTFVDDARTGGGDA